MRLSHLARLSLLSSLAATATVFADVEIKYDHYLGSKWNTVSMGVYTTEYDPVLTIKNGDVVKIDTASSSSQKFDLDLERSVAIFKKDQIELPLAPFFGQMGVAPPASAGGFGASPPTPLHGGNFDLQELCRGGTLFLPVNVNGAYFYV